MGIGKRIHAAMLAAGKRPVDIANHLGIKDAAVSQWFAKDRGPKSDRLPALASFLATTADSLLGAPLETVNENAPKGTVRFPVTPVTLTPREQMPEDIPVLGTVLGGSSGGDFTMNGQSGMRVRRPPRLAGRDDIFALFVQGDSMAPRYLAGELIYVERRRPPQNGDHCVVELKADRDGTQEAYLKRLVATTPTKLKLAQYSPPRVLEIDRKRVLQVLRVLTTSDLLGV